VTVTLEVPDGFSGVVSVRTEAEIEFEAAYGWAHRAYGVPMQVDHRLAIASGTKAFTAGTILALVEDGRVELDTSVRSLLGAALPLIPHDVTVGQLLCHRSGIGDYVDEDLPEPVPLAVCPRELDSTAAYLPALDGFAPKFPAGTRFSYCNSGYVVLAIIAERLTGRRFEDLVADHVFAPAGMTSSAFLRSDRLTGDAATGYLDDGRTNVFALPVLGSGDGGAYTTVADVRRFWIALLSGHLLSPPFTRHMVTPSTVDTGHPFGYGMGLWLDVEADLLVLEGADQGVSIRSLHDPVRARTATVVSNTDSGAWPVARQLRALLISGK
jgi:CubicO group peptidase (beta-lactamase class C family)